MVRSFVVLLAYVGATAFACAGDQQETSGQEATGFERVEQATTVSERVQQTTSSDEGRGPWSSWPEADWVQKVAERAGYRISGETLSALIANGSGQSFYIWTTPASTPKEVEKAVNDEDWQPFGSVEGVEVYGDENVWRWWVGESFTIWLQAGPNKNSRLPSLTEMEALVRASKTVPWPR